MTVCNINPRFHFCVPSYVLPAVLGGARWNRTIPEMVLHEDMMSIIYNVVCKDYRLLHYAFSQILVTISPEG